MNIKSEKLPTMLFDTPISVTSFLTNNPNKALYIPTNNGVCFCSYNKTERRLYLLESTGDYYPTTMDSPNLQYPIEYQIFTKP